MSSRIGTFVGNQTGSARSMPPPPTKQYEPDPQRVQNAQGLGIQVKRSRWAATANSAQHRQYEDPSTRAMREDGQRNLFEGSVYQESDTTGQSHVQVEDSQLDAYGRPMRYAAGGDQAYPEAEESSEGSEEDIDESGVDEEPYEAGRFDQPPQDEALLLVTDYLDAQPATAPPSIFDRLQEGDSIPPTTSGGPSRSGGDQQESQAPFMSSLGDADAARPFQHDSRDTRAIQLPYHQNVPPTQQHHRHVEQKAHVESLSSRHGLLRQTNTTTRVPLPKTIATDPVPQYAPQNPRSHPATKANAEVTQLPSGLQANQSKQAQTQLYHQAEPLSLHPKSGPSLKAKPVATDEKPGLQDVSILRAASNVDPELLAQINYAELHTRSLDNGPVAQSTVLTATDLKKPLSEQLALVQKLGREDKESFVTSLSLDHWEDAGDWFLDRFSDIVQQMKNARKERRQLAKDFGDEICDRHQAVESKKRSIKESLAEMGKNGASVLTASTPRKKQKKRSG